MSTATSVRSLKRRPELTEIVFAEAIHIPPRIADLKTFREWCRSDAYPERGDVFWIDGVIWADMHMDELDFHNAVKTEYVRVLATIIKMEQLGYFYSDRARLTSPQVGLSVEPDALFFFLETLRSRVVRRISARGRGTVELEGAVDMVLEIVSDGSENKDTVVLRKKYWEAGVKEYWLVDARHDPVRFDILRRGPGGFVTARKSSGWVRSSVFNRQFQLRSEVDEDGVPNYTLRVS